MGPYVKTAVGSPVLLKTTQPKTARGETKLFSVSQHVSGVPSLSCYECTQSDKMVICYYTRNSVLSLMCGRCILVGGRPRCSRRTQANKNGPWPPKVNSAARRKSSPMADWLFKQQLAPPVLPKYTQVWIKTLANCWSVRKRKKDSLTFSTHSEKNVGVSKSKSAKSSINSSSREGSCSPSVNLCVKI